MVRKTVTLVFCDVADSTPLGERLDPEALRDVLSWFHETARNAVERHGGTVEKYVGDAVMAAFGIPVVHEDDALRAVRAAAELRDELRALNDELERAYGVRIDVRTGVNTGEVIAGDPAQRQAFATGDAVVVAQRLEAAAGGGEILLGDATMRLVRHAVTAECLPPLELKGKSQPVTAWRLLEVEAHARAVARRLDAPLVGRTDELRRLRAELESTLESRSCRVVTILGDPGVGKSRLVAELAASLDEDALVLSGRCLPYGQGITYWPLGEVVRQLAGTEPPAVALPRLLSADSDAELVTTRVLEAVGLAPARSRSDEIYWAVRRLLETLGRTRPVLIVLDDVQWAEPALLDLVEYLAGWSRDAPLLVVCLARPDLLDVRPGWGTGGASGSLLPLAPLDEAETRALIEGVLRSDRLELVPDAAIVRATAGNPLFVEEMVRMLIDDGVLRERDGRWEAPRGMPSLRIPATIQAVLAARLDLLDRAERTVLQRASVIGEVFWWSALVELAPHDEAADTGSVLQTLVRKRLIHPERTTLPGEDAFGFGHILVRDAAYDSLPKRQRAELHERFASWVAARPASGREVDDLLGYHLEQAYGYRLEVGVVDEHAERLGREAGARLREAGRRALLRGDAVAAMHLLERSVVLPADERERLERRLLLARALRDAGDLARASTELDTVVERATAAGELELELSSLIERSFVDMYTGRGHVAEFLRLGERAAAAFAERGDESGLSQAWNLIAHAHFVECRVAPMESALAEALVHANAADDRRQVSALLTALGRAALVGPMPVEAAIERCARLRDLGAGDRALEAVLATIHAYLAAMLGRFDEARAACARSRAMLDELGMPVLLGGGRTYSGAVELLAGDPAAAEQEFRAGVDTLEAIGEKGNLATVAAYLAEALTLQDLDEEALVFTELSERCASSFDATSHVAWRATRARIRARSGEVVHAERLAREAVARAAATDYVNLQGDALARLAEVLHAAGAVDDARAAAAAAAVRYTAKGNVVAAARIETAVSALR